MILNLSIRKPPADLLLYDSFGQMVALVEASALLDTSPEWAAEWRRNIMEHGDCPATPFYLMVMPNWLYLWKNVPPVPEMIPPTLVAEAGPLLAPYFTMLDVVPEQVHRWTFEDIVQMWLSDLSWRRPETPVEPALRWAQEVGFLDAIRDGSVLHVDAAA